MLDGVIIGHTKTVITAEVWRRAIGYSKEYPGRVYIMRSPHKDEDAVNINSFVHREMLLDGWETIAVFENGKYIG